MAQARNADSALKTGDEILAEVRLLPDERVVRVPLGTLLESAIAEAGVHLPLPCGGQGRCGRCVVEVREGSVNRRSTARLTDEEVAAGQALACQTVVTGDVTVWVPPREQRLERFERGDRAEKAAEESVIRVHECEPWVTVCRVVVAEPSMADNTPDLERLQRELARTHGVRVSESTLTALRHLPEAVRQARGEVDVLVAWQEDAAGSIPWQVLDVLPGDAVTRTAGLAVDIGTTTVAVRVADLTSGEILGQSSAYNDQTARGEDVISRIIYGRGPARRRELRERVLGTINALVDEVLEETGIKPEQVVSATVAGNTTMMHLFLGMPADHIRLEPYIPVAGRLPRFHARQLELHIHPEAAVDCLPAIGAYVGADITAGVLRAGFHKEEPITLFIDVGTNGEMVLGNEEWLISCACSAGPAFEGAGAVSGMRAVPGAIEDAWIDPHTLDSTVVTLGDVPPLGICGSGMISLLGEMLVTGVIDKSGHIGLSRSHPRLRTGDQGPEYVVVWAEETGAGQDIVLTETDVQNLMRAKAAIYAGATVLCESVGVTIADVQRVLVGGAFGRHIDVEKAIQIGLLPDLPWENFSYLGNTSLQGAYLALTCREYRMQLDELAAKMTYLELSADNRFMDAFTSAMFLPHTDETLFPSLHKMSAGVAGSEGGADR